MQAVQRKMFRGGGRMNGYWKNWGRKASWMEGFIYIHTHTHCSSFLLCLALIFPLKIFAELRTLFHISTLFLFAIHPNCILISIFVVFSCWKNQKQNRRGFIASQLLQCLLQQLCLQQKSITRMRIQPFVTAQQKGKSKLVLQVQTRQSV